MKKQTIMLFASIVIASLFLSLISFSLVLAYSPLPVPSVTIVSPIDGDIIQSLQKKDSIGTVISFSAKSDIPIYKCTLFVNEQAYTDIYGASYNSTVTADLPQGNYRIYITCLDTNGIEGKSNAVSFYVCKNKGQCKKF